ncbi:hypothetical protein WLZ34_00180 [Thermogladius sp. KZ2Tp1]|uniref:hypothetical protein n=1 Tax=Thermogladius sp. KZ2Tp1 TaxID=3136289 RepID=UPI003DA99157
MTPVLFALVGLVLVFWSLLAKRPQVSIVLMAAASVFVGLSVSELVGHVGGLIIASLYVSVLIVLLMVWFMVSTAETPKTDVYSVLAALLLVLTLVAASLVVWFVEPEISPRPIARGVSWTDYVLLTVLVVVALTGGLWFVEEAD